MTLVVLVVDNIVDFFVASAGEEEDTANADDDRDGVVNDDDDDVDVDEDDDDESCGLSRPVIMSCGFTSLL